MDTDSLYQRHRHPGAILYFDIETEPLPEERLREICPPFDPEAVKVGNLGPEKAKEKIANAEKNHFKDFVETAALSPLTGRVCAIGLLGSTAEKWGQKDFSDRYFSDSVEIIDCSENEAAGLAKFWKSVEMATMLVGFNTHPFDLPFLIRRSWIVGVPVPGKMRLERDRWWPDWNIDLRKIWQLGDPNGSGKLDEVGRALGFCGKTGDHGHEFGRLWREDRACAEEYLRQDVMLCAQIHGRLAFAEYRLPDYAKDCAKELETDNVLF